MAYHPVTPSKRKCAYCQSVFEAKDRRRIYCKSSCNTLAWMARQPKEEKETTSSSKVELPLSLTNVATVATGSLAATGVVALFNNEPTNSQIVENINSLARSIGFSMGQIEKRFNSLEDFNRALEGEYLGLGDRVRRTKQRRLEKGK